MNRRRRVIVSEDYLDGIMGLSVRAPEEYDETCWLIDAELLDALAAAENAYDAAKERIRAAWLAASEVRNPSYKNVNEAEE